ncbi:MAG: response regulator [Bacillota bacterium]|nr:response regulator [Bacillota bacterium]
MKILVIDDSAVYRTQIIKFLREFLPEAEYITAHDGAEGWNLYKKERPEATLMDLLMPGLSGQEVLKLIKGMEAKAKAKIIILTADIQKYTRDEVEELGATKVINKPISREKAAQIADVIKGD